MATDRARAEESRGSASRVRGPDRAVVCHALYLVNLASPDPEIHAEVDHGDARDAGDGRSDRRRGVVFHVGSHLGSGSRGVRRGSCPRCGSSSS